MSEKTIKNIYQSMAGIVNEVKAVSKSNVADMGKAGRYKFRGIDDIYNTLHEAFASQNVFIIPEILEEKSEIIEKVKMYNGEKNITYSKYTTLKVKYTFFASDGSSVSAIGIGEAIDTSDKGSNKAQSSALKYVLMQTFLIPTEEEKDVENQNDTIKTTTQSYQKPTTDIIWLSEENLKKTLTGTAHQARLVLSSYSTNTHKMSKDFRSQIENYIKDEVEKEKVSLENVPF